jgi:uncharacterized protein
MKLQPDRFDFPAVTGYGSDWVAVLGEKVKASTIICSDGQRLDWACNRFEDLTAQHFEQLAQLPIEVVIFGSGQKLRFAPPALMQSLMQKRIGLETMDTQAACRTYNILAGEGRKVALALLMETSWAAKAIPKISS